MRAQFLHVRLLFQRLSIILLICAICRLLFFYWNASLFPSTGFLEFIKLMFYGMRFDVSAIVYSNLLFIALHLLPFPQRGHSRYQMLLKILFYVTNGAALFFAVIDFEYFKYSLKRSSADVTGFYFDFYNLFPQLVKDFWSLLLLLIGLLALMEFLYRKTSLKTPPVARLNFPVQLIILIVCSGLALLGARGGFQLRPISPMTALQYADATLAPVVTNTPFHIFYSLGQKGITEKKYFSEEKLSAEFSFCRKNEQSNEAVIAFPDAARQPNIVLIIMESFSQEQMGLYGAEKSYTPFLDSLGKSALVYMNMFANGTRSVEGIPAICASLPSLMDESFIFSQYQTNKIDGIGNLLKKTGYSTAFFHGGINGTFNFDSFARLAGFDDYYGKNEYANDEDFDGNWGIFDEPFFRFTAQKINGMKEPFCTALFSLSSHHPYTIPEEYARKYRDIDDAFLRSIRYSDYSLQQFFKIASEMPWYQNTLFIITADHKGVSYNDYYHTWTGRYSIPLIVYKPESEMHGVIDFPVQQADIVPGILDYADYPFPFCTFGESIFKNSNHKYVYHYMSGVSQIIDGNYILHFDGSNTIAMYKFGRGQMPEHDIKDDFPQDRQRLENRLKAVMQTFHSAMLKNQLSRETQKGIP